MRTEPPLPRGQGRWWLWPLFFALLAVPSSWALAAVAAVLAARFARRALRVARQRRRHEQTRAAASRDSGTIVLGAEPSGRGVLLSDRELEAHGLILGASGAGKSTTLLAILSAQIRRGGAVVAIDLKGSPAFVEELRRAATAAGRPIRCWTPDGPERWNPLAVGNATELKDKLIATERFTEPHYQRAAERYVQAAIRVSQEADPDRPVTLARVVELLEPQRLAALARRLPDARAEHLRDYLGALTPDQLSAVRGLAARLAVISESHTGEYLTPSPDRAPIDLRAALRGEEVVVFSLNSSTYGGLAAQLATLAVQDLVSASGHRLSELPPAGTRALTPALVGIDEFSAIGSDNVISLLARGREAGVSVLLATQELADLDRAARGLRDQVLGNTAVKIAHRQDVPESAETVARLAGRERVWERSYQLHPSGLGGVDARRGTLRQVERYAIEPDQVRSLRTGEAVVIVKSPQTSARLTRVIPPPADRDGPER